MPKSSPSLPLSVCPRCGQVIPAHAVLGACPHCLLAAGLASEPAAPGNSPPPSPAELAPEFPQLDLLELLGRGGMGAVYKARQRALDRIVALKLLRPGLGDDPSFSERFAREARALAQLNHPGIVTLYEFGRTSGGLFFILMEFVDGVNLRQLLAAGRLAPREALAIIPALCDALQYAHDRGLVHRDIKPENILVDRLGRVKVADFGLAKLADRPESAVGTSDRATASSARADFGVDLTEAGKVIGTPRYMAPEQSERPAEVDHRADIYALGVVLYQMLTGELPDAQQLQPPSRRVQLDVRLDEIVLRALEKEPSRRYQHASAMKTQVENVSGMSAILAGGARGSRSLPIGRSIAGRPIAVAVVAAVLAGYGLYVIAEAAVDSPGKFSTTFEVMAFPIGLGLWRFRPWWRYAALTFLAAMLATFALRMALMTPLTVNPMPAFITDNFDVDFHPTYFKDQPQVAALFLASLDGLQVVLTAWMWRVLRRPGIKALFVSSRPWSRPWLEWTAFACVQLLALLGNFLAKPNDGFARETATTVVSSSAQPTPTPTAATPGAAVVSPAPDAAQHEILQLRLAQAQRDLEMTRAKFDAGLATDEQLQDARRDVEVLKAELIGDTVAAAEVKLAAAEEKLKLLNARYAAGLGTKQEVETATLAVEVLKVELRAATRTRGQALPVPASAEPGGIQKSTSTVPVDSAPKSEPLTAPSSDSPGQTSALLPQTSFTVPVLGATTHAGSYQLRPGSTLLDALAAAGGANALANTSNISLTHTDSAGHRTTTRHDLNAILKGSAENPGIVAGDFVFVPERIF